MSQPRRQPVRVTLPAFGVSVFESVHAADFHAPPMRHRFWKVLLPLHGEGRIDLGNTSWPCRAGAPVIIPAGVRHQLRDEPGPALTLLAVCIGRRVLGEVGTDRLPRGPLQPDPLLRETISSMLRRMLYEQSVRERGYELVLVGLAKQLIGALLRGGDHDRRAASASEKAVRAYVEALGRRFFEQVDIREAADRTGLSRRRFTQLFRQHTGDSHHRYVQRLRLAHAKRLLRDTERSIPSIAFECGFGDLSSFYRAFARHEGRKPMTFRHTG